MKPKMILKITVDIVMTIVLLLLMTYEMIGQISLEYDGGHGRKTGAKAV